MAPTHTTFAFASPLEGGALFLLALERLQTLYPWAYARGAISMSEGAEFGDLNVKLSVRDHLEAAVLDSSPGGGDPSPTRPSSLVGAAIDLSPVTQKTWLDGGSAYGGQDTLDLSALVGANTEM